MSASRFLPWIAAGIVLCCHDARAFVYATDIKVNGSLQSITNAGSAPVSISYRLNQSATTGVTVDIWEGTTNVATISGGTAMGLNTVVWGGTNNSGAPVGLGVYSVSITAGASGFAQWQQISVDSNPGMPAFYPLGIAVDNNTNSPYYGRVVMSCAESGSAATPTVPLAAQMIGLYKMNADGTQADEGWFGYASYTSDDAGDLSSGGQMPDSGGLDPMKIRIGDDDRIYWVDDSYIGAILACDMQATTNQIVITDNIYSSASYYDDNPDYSDLTNGIQEFDVTGTTTTNAALWLCDNDSPNWGIWMYHLTNGASNTNDTTGVQVVEAGFDLGLGSSGGCTVDQNLDIFVGEDRTNQSAVYGAMVFTNWNGGALSPPNTNGGAAFNYAVGGAPGEAKWGFGCDVDVVCTNDPTFEAVRDVVINSRLNPTLVACPMSVGADNGTGGGIRVLDATNGSIVMVTNGENIQSLANLDFGHAYSCAAWDNVGNLYAASTNLNLWRVWSPPGPNTNTTVATAQIFTTTASSSPITITSIAVKAGTVTIQFTGTGPASAFALKSSSLLKGPYATVAGAVATGGPDVFTVSTATAGAVQFYRISE